MTHRYNSPSGSTLQGHMLYSPRFSRCSFIILLTVHCKLICYTTQDSVDAPLPSFWQYIACSYVIQPKASCLIGITILLTVHCRVICYTAQGSTYAPLPSFWQYIASLYVIQHKTQSMLLCHPSDSTWHVHMLYNPRLRRCSSSSSMPN